MSVMQVVSYKSFNVGLPLNVIGHELIINDTNKCYI